MNTFRVLIIALSSDTSPGYCKMEELWKTLDALVQTSCF